MSATHEPNQEDAGEQPEWQRRDLTTRWSTAFAERLQRVARHSSLGLLSQPDERRFQALCEELHTLSDLIDRFELTQRASERAT